MGKLGHYQQLLALTYEEAVEYLLQCHGLVRDDFYREKSYDRFLKGEIKSITKGQYQQTKEGLFCHHVAEDQFENLGSLLFIKKKRYPYIYQTKSYLVYCDLVEHLILHALIMDKTSGEFGAKGFYTYLYPTFREWYLKKKEPQRSWLQPCYARSYLTEEEGRLLIQNILRLPVFKESLSE